MRHIVLSCPNVIQDSTDKNIQKAKLLSLFITGNEKCPQTAPWNEKASLGR